MSIQPGHWTMGRCAHQAAPRGKQEKFLEVLKWLQLQKRGTGGENTADVSGVFHVSNWNCLDFSELELLQMVANEVKLFIEMEQWLEQGGSGYR
ncbi:Creatine kinase B-type [Cricetulus griseus]|uniref:Creatine kinase B-type n=1 Tax=Cricetulus griseus TaxID=10029 RepID=G3HVN7_CRIGR|nr:Creatine kinase B-type [Cricetulus griseus]